MSAIENHLEAIEVGVDGAVADFERSSPSRPERKSGKGNRSPEHDAESEYEPELGDLSAELAGPIQIESLEADEMAPELAPELATEIDPEEFAEMLSEGVTEAVKLYEALIALVAEEE